MPNRSPVSKDTYIRHLPFSHIKRVSNLLDPGRLWENFVKEIPKQLNSKSLSLEDDFERRYSMNHISLFERGGSPTQKIINDWATQNPTLEHLIIVLIRSQLYQAADYLSANVLKEGPVRRVHRNVGNGCDHSFENSVSNLQPPVKPDLKPNSPQKHLHSGAENINVNDGGDDKNYEKMVEFDAKPGQSMEEEPSAFHADSPSVPNKSVPIPKEASPCLSKEQNQDETKHRTERDACQEDTVVRRPVKGLDDMINTAEVPYERLKYITNNFDEREWKDGGRVIGKGGFGTVFLGVFHDGAKVTGRVAVKCLLEDKDDIEDHFKNELIVLSKYRHENLVSLLGFCCERKKRCLIYEYMQNGSLEDRLLLKDHTQPLTVKKRVEIIVGTARGIVFLNNKGIIHRDIKSANVLLDEAFVPKIGDFATARAGPSGCGKTMQDTSLVIGTPAYLAPEALECDVSAKLDSYSFGVVILEILTSLPVLDLENKREEKSLKSHIEENCEDIMDFVDKSVGEWDCKTANILFDVAQKCYAYSKRKRATTADVFPSLEKLLVNC